MKKRQFSRVILPYSDLNKTNDYVEDNVQLLAQDGNLSDGIISGLSVLASSPASWNVKVQTGVARDGNGDRMAVASIQTEDVEPSGAPGGGNEVYMSIFMAYTYTQSESDVDLDGITYYKDYVDGYTLTITEGTVATLGNAVKPIIPVNSICLCDILVTNTVYIRGTILQADIDTSRQDIVGNVAVNTTSMGTLINNALTKTPAVDADKVTIWDSVSGLLKTITWANVKAALKTYFDTIYSPIANRSIPGYINGGLLFNAVNVPPYIRAGSYDINGVMVNLTSNKALAVADILGDKTLRAYTWYYAMMDNAGNVAIQAAFGGAAAVKTYSITSISGGNQINFSTSAGGTQPLADMWVAIEGATTATNNGFWKISSIHGAPVDYVVVEGALTNQAGAAGTIKVYYGMSTYHGTGTETGITTEANFIKYTPSPADSEYSHTNDWAQFDYILNGYYSKWTGYTGYRILGVFNVGAANITDIISYKSGKNKNDNHIYITNAAAGRIGNIQQYDTWYRVWGNDTVVTNDGANATRITGKRTGNIWIAASGYNTVAVVDMSIYRNTDALVLYGSPASNRCGAGSVANRVDIGTYYNTQGSADYIARLSAIFEIN
jgi:hypothetical protein